jgi:glutamate-ammonia-ligase adenylyltransferase
LSLDRSGPLTELARLGFSELGTADAELTELGELIGAPRASLIEGAGRAADPDAAVAALLRIARRDPEPIRGLRSDGDALSRS